MDPEFLTRRGMIAGSSAALLWAGPARADDPVIAPEMIAARQNAPIIPRTVERRFNTRPTIREPNAMQFTADGKLLLLDQVDPNKVFTVDPANGQVLAQVQTEAIHGSGITIGDGGAWWITSTKALQGPPVTLKVNPGTGKTHKKWVTPGWGYYGTVSPERG